MDFDFASIAGLLTAVAAAFAAAFAAAIAYQAHQRMAKADRERRVREVSLLANKVDVGAAYINELGEQLKLAYETLFTFARRTGSGLLDQCKDEIKEKQEAVKPMQQAARHLLDPAKLSDDQITKHLLELDGHLVCIDRIREKFHADLASVESQNSDVLPSLSDPQRQNP